MYKLNFGHHAGKWLYSGRKRISLCRLLQPKTVLLDFCQLRPWPQSPDLSQCFPIEAINLLRESAPKIPKGITTSTNVFEFETTVAVSNYLLACSVSTRSRLRPYFPVNIHFKHEGTYRRSL